MFVAPVWVDASYNGELLALSKAEFLQGADEAYDGDIRGTAGSDTLGQTITYSLQIAMDAEPVSPPEPPAPFGPDPTWGADPFRYADALYFGTFNLSFAEIWTRRRSYASATISTGVADAVFSPPPFDAIGGVDAHAKENRVGNFHPPPVNIVSPGDVSLQIWQDYYWGYVWHSKQSVTDAVEAGQWRGGYDLDTLAGAERYSRLAYDHVKAKAPPALRARMRLDSSKLGTCHGAALSGSISTILTVLSWIFAGIYMCGAQPSPVCA